MIILNFLDSQNNEELHIMESTDYDSVTEVNHISWEFLNKSNQHRFNYNFDMKMFFPDTLNRLLIDSKYQIDKFYGNYDFLQKSGFLDPNFIFTRIFYYDFYGSK